MPVSRADRVFEGCETQEQMEARILGKRVPRSALKGKDVPLPVPYAKRTHILERDVLKACKDVLKFHGLLHFRHEGGGKLLQTKNGTQLVPSEMSGMPDFIGVLPDGRFLGVECKTSGGHLSQVQYSVLKRLHKSNAVVCVVVDPSVFMVWLTTLLHTGILSSKLYIDGFLPVL